MAFSLALWRDRRGRFSALRLAVLSFLALPVALAAYAFLTTGFGARPVNDLIHRTGYWALMFVLVSLSVTPLARIGRFARLMDVRRMLGVGAACYAATHITLFITDQKFNLFTVVSEIVHRVYLIIGFIALSGLLALAATSTDAMVRRLGARRWQNLHRIVYGIGVLALIHFFQQTKADVWVPTLVAGLFVWLMGYRVLAWLRKGYITTAALAVLAVIASALVFAAEALGVGFYYQVSPFLVLQSAFDFDLDMIRPGWLVLGTGLIVAPLNAVRGWRRTPLAGRAASPPRPTQVEEPA